jgi:protein TonB
MKTAIGTSLALHFLLLSAADETGRALPPTKPTVIEVALGKPTVTEVDLGGKPCAPQQVRDKLTSAYPTRRQSAHPPTKAARSVARRARAAAPVLPGPSPHVAEAAAEETNVAATIDKVTLSSAAVLPAASQSGNAASPATSEGTGILPYVISGPPPSYPKDARSNGFAGKVKVKVLISARGIVEDTVIVESSGNASLDDAAKQGLRRWLFRPAYRDGRAVAAWVVVPVMFKLE